MSTQKRAVGCYWVRADWKIALGTKDWQPAYWNGRWWFLIYHTVPLNDSDLVEIGTMCVRQENPQQKKPTSSSELWIDDMPWIDP